MGNKVALVTGGARGIGAGLADRLGKLGYDVVVNYVGSADKAIEVSKKIRDAYGVDSFAVQGDISNYADCQKMADATMERFGRIDVLVNNAGKSLTTYFMDKKPEDFPRIVAINLVGHMNMCHVFLPLLIKQEESCIVNITSVCGVLPSPIESDYGAAKAGLVNFTRSLAGEVAQRKCRINCIAPGPIMTDMLRNSMAQDPAVEATILDPVPLKFIGDPCDIADGMEYLINARYVTGTTLSVSGGMYMNN